MNYKSKDELKTYCSSMLKAVRTEHNLSQEAMAEILQINVRSYADLECGKSLFSTPTMLLFIIRFELDANKFVYDTAPFFDDSEEN